MFRIIKKIIRSFFYFFNYEITKISNEISFPTEIDEANKKLIEECIPFSMTGPKRMIALNFCLKNILDNKVDGDFVECKISNCFFIDIAGDGADFSGSDVEITDCRFQNISDKAISIGENSRANISKSSIENVSFGIVSKDQSVTKVENNNICLNKQTSVDETDYYNMQMSDFVDL